MPINTITNFEFLSLYGIRKATLEGRLGGGGSSVFPAGNAGELVSYTGIPGQVGAMHVDAVLDQNSHNVPASEAVWAVLNSLQVNGTATPNGVWSFSGNVGDVVIAGNNNTTFVGRQTDTYNLTWSYNIPSSIAVNNYVAAQINNIPQVNFNVQPNEVLIAINNSAFISRPADINIPTTEINLLLNIAWFQVNTYHIF